MHLSNFDPDEPRKYDYTDEADRLMGVVCSRVVIAAVVLWLLGYDVTEGIVGIVGEPWYMKIIVLYAAVKIGWPTLQMGEIVLVDIKTAVGQLRK